ncbi:hypothetical protein [Shewanella baltica]|uniref:hypothetical protein n=1 Tax=Shewanella baltica TaxID=62322 RepID=UPI0001DB8291|nr:hypothetical protein [Shewanella baltica]ADT96562.1 hypothetical protein Sbal678_4438 [Shewanella baltica OS678]EHC07385.1 hypothetical protein Sbal625DRAFT_0938 [Shewanella baltica OS625]MCS6130007.1 hypothetical protein [Shewanella baltica]MCS6141916.1 hypothetical protein [Shewanella baltica]MCS6148251.1 hypothetical protein [Shewanella baltica]
MLFRPVRVFVTTLFLTTFGFFIMFLVQLSEPTCVDDLSELKDIVAKRNQTGDTTAANVDVGFDKEKNQWCYIETSQ